jgi:hypothetical protein
VTTRPAVRSRLGSPVPQMAILDDELKELFSAPAEIALRIF